MRLLPLDALDKSVATLNANRVTVATPDGPRAFAPGQLQLVDYELRALDSGEWDFPRGQCRPVRTIAFAHALRSSVWPDCMELFLLP